MCVKYLIDRNRYIKIWKCKNGTKKKNAKYKFQNWILCYMIQTLYKESYILISAKKNEFSYIFIALVIIYIKYKTYIFSWSKQNLFSE